jgi:hypothetical protein
MENLKLRKGLFTYIYLLYLFTYILFLFNKLILILTRVDLNFKIDMV